MASPGMLGAIVVVDDQASPVRVATGGAASESGGSIGLVRVASVGALVHAVYFPLQHLATVSAVEGFTWRIAVAGVATCAYVPLHLRHVRFALRGSRAPAVGWTLLCMAAAIGGAVPFAGRLWPGSFFALAGSFLIVASPRWAAAGFAGSVGSAAVLASGSAGGETAYTTFVVGYQALALCVLVRLVAATRRLHEARAALAIDAVAGERRRIEDEIRRTVGSVVEEIAARGHAAQQLTRGDAEAPLRTLVELSRRAMADVRQMVRAYRRRSLQAELDTAVDLLAASGIAVRVVVRDTLRPGDDVNLREQLRPEVARLLTHGSVRACVLTVSRRGGHAEIECTTQVRGSAGTPPAHSTEVVAPEAIHRTGQLRPDSLRYTRLALSTLHVVVAVALLEVNTWGRAPRPLAAAVPLVIALGALQLRHSLAAARGKRPPCASLTFALITMLVVIPQLWFQIPWWSTNAFVVASAAMLFRGRAAWVLCGVPLVAVPVGLGIVYGLRFDPWRGVVAVSGWFGLYVIIAGTLYATAQLIRTLDELHRLRLDLADQAVASERFRVSRDLHDLLSHSLTAVSLKGDLALALLPTEPAAARAEINGIVAAARTALRDTRAVTDARHTASLAAALDSAAALLEAAKIDARIDVDLAGLPPPLEDVLAWATREGVTNVVRHSNAATCSIIGWRDDGAVRLEIANDGVHPTNGDGPSAGHGLAGLAERLELMSARLSTVRSDGWFRLVVEIPEPRA
jgi:two-component system sensor histidine kinase DesK